MRGEGGGVQRGTLLRWLTSILADRKVLMDTMVRFDELRTHSPYPNCLLCFSFFVIERFAKDRPRESNED